MMLLVFNVLSTFISLHVLLMIPLSLNFACLSCTNKNKWSSTVHINLNRMVLSSLVKFLSAKFGDASQTSLVIYGDVDKMKISTPTPSYSECDRQELDHFFSWYYFLSSVFAFSA